MDRIEAMKKLLAFAKSRADDLRTAADKEHLDDFDLKASERTAAELDEAALVLAVKEDEQLVAIPTGKTCLALSRGQVSIVDRALTCFSKSLQAARDIGVIKHETFCSKADRARAVQFMVWEIAQKFDDAKAQQVEPAGGDPAQKD